MESVIYWPPLDGVFNVPIGSRSYPIGTNLKLAVKATTGATIRVNIQVNGVQNYVTATAVDGYANFVVPTDKQASISIGLGTNPGPGATGGQFWVFVKGTGSVTIATVNISVTVSPAGGGQIVGGGETPKGQQAIVGASASEGYVFTGWYKGAELVSSDANYALIATANITLVALFSLAGGGMAWHQAEALARAGKYVRFDSWQTGKSLTYGRDAGSANAVALIYVETTAGDGAKTVVRRVALASDFGALEWGGNHWRETTPPASV